MGLRRLRVLMAGAVQGVGFRPFVYRLASELDLKGWVLNSGSGLVIEAEGPEATLERFLVRLERERPPSSLVLAREVSILEPAGYATFEIRRSDEQEEKTVSLLPDLATCPQCLRELNDPADRRYRYPFTNCTACGPRYTIILDIPYDRPRTTMRGFEMCPDCRREYTDPADRRFHAQPNACPVCGPRVWIELASGKPAEASLSPHPDPIRAAADALRVGHIVALKGIGGFQLLVDARNEQAVARLRRLKQREEKPFALMAPTLEAIRECAEMSDVEERLLRSPAAPIVLLRPRDNHPLAPNVAQSSPYLGFMLPYSPLHHLLMQECDFPIVATSGNLSDEPIAIDNQEARVRLGGIADLFLMHDRPVARPCDDSVARVSRSRQSVLRRARGYAPLPVLIRRRLPAVLAVGGHLKNTVAIVVGRQVYLSQHVGDLDTAEARGAFVRAIEDLCRLYRFQPELVACDLHPDYAPTHWAQSSGLPVYAVQHHQAHVASCAAENDLEGEYLGVGWDGTGFGLDGSVWGGEFFLVQEGRFERVAHLRPFRLPGGEAAVKEGWRVAASLQFETFGPEAIENQALLRMIQRGINSPWSTSVGRLFDAVAALAGLARINRFEGQAAMQLERAIGWIRTEDCYPLDEKDGVADWRPLIAAVQDDVSRDVSAGMVSARFHNALAAWIVRVARRTGVRQVALSGGVFQNAYLTERTAAQLEQAGIRVATHQRVPANDGGLALGQAVIAGRAFSGGS
ncbi:MAG: carbamoyltransferase HypF [Bryobacteraceae bacterium]